MAKYVSYIIPRHQYQSKGLQARGMILVKGDTAGDTDFAMFYTLYHIFQQESYII